MQKKEKKQLTKILLEKKKEKGLLWCKILTAVSLSLSLLSLLFSCSANVNKADQTNKSEIKNQIVLNDTEIDTFFTKNEVVNEYLTFDRYIFDTSSYTSLMNVLYTYVSNNTNEDNIFQFQFFSLQNNINTTFLCNEVVLDNTQLYFYYEDVLQISVPYQSTTTTPYLTSVSLSFINGGLYPFDSDLMLHVQNAYYFKNGVVNSSPITYYMPPYIAISGEQNNFVVNARFNLSGESFYRMEYVYKTKLNLINVNGEPSQDYNFSIMSYDYDNNIYYYGVSPNTRTEDNNSWNAGYNVVNGTLTNVALTKKSVTFFDYYFQYNNKYYSIDYVINNAIYNQVLSSWGDWSDNSAAGYIYNRIKDNANVKTLIRSYELYDTSAVILYGGLSYRTINMYATYNPAGVTEWDNFTLEIELYSPQTNITTLVSGVVIQFLALSQPAHVGYYLTNTTQIISINNLRLDSYSNFNVIYDVFIPYSNQESRPPFIDNEGNTTGNAADSVFADVFTLINHAFSSILAFLSIEIFGKYTLGVFLLVPLMITIMLFIIGLFKR